MGIVQEPKNITSEDAEMILLYYANRLHVTERCVHENEAMLRLCKDLLGSLIAISITDLLQLIDCDFKPYTITAADIPQFSSIEDCVRVPHLIMASQLEDITYGQMGYLLRTEPRTEIADLKYGENHAKVAAQMGLCVISKHKIYPSCLGVEFDKLSSDNKKNLLPKLALFIPFIQNVFVGQMTSEDVEQSLAILSETTRKRRLPNVWTLINLVNEHLPYELQILRY